MKILIVGEFFPWPAWGGGLLRLANAVEALSSIGDADLFTLSLRSRDLPLDVPPEIQINRLKVVSYPQIPSRARWQTRWLLRRGVPRDVVKRCFDGSARSEFENWTDDSYDLVWFSTAALYGWMGRPRLGPTIVDFVDLEDEKASRRTRVTMPAKAPQGLARKIRRRLSLAQENKNVRDWSRYQRSVASEVARVTLCSDSDVDRSGLKNAVVIPNSYPRPTKPVGHLEVADPPVLLFQGTLAYKPNTDAAHWLVNKIAPKIRETDPTVTVRLAGTSIPEVDALSNPPSVTVVGRVSSMEDELSKADIALVPIRFGSGTRVKILESFAHRVPVVSTTIGAEGFDMIDGVHLLIADDGDAFAAACHRLLTDLPLREGMVKAAEQWYLERHQSSVGRERLQDLAQEVASTKKE